MTGETEPKGSVGGRRFTMPPEDELSGLDAIEALVSPWVPSVAERAPVAPGFEAPRAWTRLLRQEHARSARSGHPTSVVVAELSGLGQLAALVGLEAVERVRAPVAEMIRQSVRESDSVVQARQYGFRVLMPETDEHGAADWASRVRAECDAWLAAGRLGVRLSIGVAALGRDGDPEAALVIAEARMRGDRRDDQGAAVATSATEVSAAEKPEAPAAPQTPVAELPEAPVPPIAGAPEAEPDAKARKKKKAKKGRGDRKQRGRRADRRS